MYFMEELWVYTIQSKLSYATTSGIQKSGRNKGLSLTRMGSCKRPHDETIESGRLQEL